MTLEWRMPTLIYRACTNVSGKLEPRSDTCWRIDV